MIRHPARQHLIERIEKGRRQNQQRCPMHAVGARADDDQRAEEADQHGKPAPNTDALAQERHGKRHHHQWLGEKYRGRRRHRNVNQADDEGDQGDQL
ncbi:MAG: hypothetical protein VYE58_01255 [Pseudomonadota bacterium]|nr:hypothetical protein [Pseudomonadota bacterium]